MKLRTKLIIGLAFIVVSFLSLGAGLYGGRTETATAATSVTAKCLTYGTTTVGSSNTGGCPDNFKIYMSGASVSGASTIYDNALLDWSYYTFTIEPSGACSHLTFRLIRDGHVYVSKSLSGSGNLTLYESALPDGMYELEYTGRYKPLVISEYVTYSYSYHFEADKTPPSTTLKAGGSSIRSGSYTNQQIVYSAEDKHFSRIQYKSPKNSGYINNYTTSYTVPATDSNNGWWYFYALDTLGASSSTVSVYLDTIAPLGSVIAGGNRIENGGYTNKAVSYTATDAGGIAYYQVKKPYITVWESYTAGTSLAGMYGWYTFRAVDRAGNISEEYEVYYDISQPTGKLYGGTTEYLSGYATNAEYVKYEGYSAYAPIAGCYVKLPGASNYTAYLSGTPLTKEGTYYFYCVSKAGMPASAISITLDKTKPVGALYGGAYNVANGGYTNAEYIRFLATDLTRMTTYVKLPGAASYVEYTMGAKFTEEGRYSFYARDEANNVSDTYTVTLDRRLPKAQLYVDDKPCGNNGYTNGGHIRFESDGANCYVKLPGSDAFAAYLSGAEYYKPGKYVFYSVSEAGSSTGEYTIVIDRTAKPLELGNVENGTTDGDAVLTWTDEDPDEFAPVQTVTVNGKPYKKGEPIYTIDTGVYEVSCIDAAGNTWTTEFSSTKRNVLTQTLQKEYYEALDTEGEPIAFGRYDAAFAFAAAQEKRYVQTGEWKSETWDAGIAMDGKDSVNAKNGTYFVYKKSGNPKKQVAYFTEERLNEVIAEYAKAGITRYYYWQKEPANIADGENLYAYSDERTVLGSSIEFGENVACLIDGETLIGSVYDTEGRHLLTVSDEWGNTCEYTLIVIRRASEIRYAVGGGSNNVVAFDRTYYFKDEVTVSIADGYDEIAMFSVTDENGGPVGCFSLDESCVIKKSGRYTVQAINHFGKSEVFCFVLSLEAPKAELAENTAKKKLEVTIIKSADKESHIQSLEIYKSIDDGKTWTLLEQDDYGKIISLNTLSYGFRTSGIYKVVLTDEFRSGFDAVSVQHDYTQPIPEGILIGVENNGCTNGVVAFEWKDEAIVTLIKDGEEIGYVSGKKLKEDGRYSLTIENYDGSTQTYTFTIDTIPPEILLAGVKNGGKTTDGVTISKLSEEAEVKVYLDNNEIGYKLGEKLTKAGKYRVVVTDMCGNSSEYTFEIKSVGKDTNFVGIGVIVAIAIGALVSIGVAAVIILKKRRNE